jgi:hypothetical protein
VSKYGLSDIRVVCSCRYYTTLTTETQGRGLLAKAAEQARRAAWAKALRLAAGYFLVSSYQQLKELARDVRMWRLGKARQSGYAYLIV